LKGNDIAMPYTIQPNDVLKFGSQQFLVKEIGTPRARTKGTEQIEYGLFANSSATNMDGLYDTVKQGKIAV